MSRGLKIVLIAVAGIVLVPILALILGWTALVLDGSGKWPFDPLERVENTLSLSNGGLLEIEAIEQRGPRSDGWTVYARYWASEAGQLEEIGVWEGYNHSPEVFVAGRLVVLPSPDQTTLFVRQTDGRWKFFSLRFPTEASSLSMSHYTTLTTLTESELARIRSDLDPDEIGWHPSVSILSFRPESKELQLKYQTNLSTVRYLRLKLSEDGGDLSLMDVRKVKVVP